MSQDYNATINLPKTAFPMRAGLPKREPDMLKQWYEKDIYGKLMEKNKGKPKCILHDGPPFSNGYIHMGTAMNKVLKDFIVRYKNMSGWHAPYRPGWDNHGMPIESAIIKQNRLDRKKMSIPEFRTACHKFASDYVNIQRDQFKRLGGLGDWDNPYLTMDPAFEAEEVKVFGKMYEKGYIDPTFNQNVGFTDRDAWYNGKVGCIMTNGEGHMEWVIGNLEAAQGADKVIVGPPLEGTGNVSELTGCTLGVKGEKGYSNWGGYYGGYAITQGTKDPYKTLDLLEYLISPEGSMLRLYGIEGTHYTLDDNGNVIVDLDGRNAERINYFEDVTNPDGTKSCAGLHKMGSRFGYNVDWDYFEETGKIAVATDIGALYPKYREYVQQALEYTKDMQTSALLNVTAFPSTIDSRKSEVMNIASQFVNKAIVGTVNLTSDWTAMLKDLDNAGYQTVRSVMRETAEELGIIG